MRALCQALTILSHLMESDGYVEIDVINASGYQRSVYVNPRENTNGLLQRFTSEGWNIETMSGKQLLPDTLLVEYGIKSGSLLVVVADFSSATGTLSSS